MTDRVTFLESQGVQFRATLGGRLCWRWGMRSSADQHCETFETAAQAAAHFLATPEGYAFVVGYGRREYARGMQMRVDDYKLLHDHAKDQARQIARLTREVSDLKSAAAGRQRSGYRRLLQRLRLRARDVAHS